MVPWSKITASPHDYIDPIYFPADVAFKEPTKWKKPEVTTILSFWRERQRKGEVVLEFKLAAPGDKRDGDGKHPKKPKARIDYESDFEEDMPLDEGDDPISSKEDQRLEKLKSREVEGGHANMSNPLTAVSMCVHLSTFISENPMLTTITRIGAELGSPAMVAKNRNAQMSFLLEMHKSLQYKLLVKVVYDSDVWVSPWPYQ